MEDKMVVTIPIEDYQELIKSDILFDQLVMALMKAAARNNDGSALQFDEDAIRFICETQLPEAYSARLAQLDREHADRQEEMKEAMREVIE